MQIRLATYEDKASWDDYVLKHKDGAAYQLFAWRMAVERAYGFKGCYLLAEDKSGICGILPLINFRIPLFGSRLISLPYCDAGGTLAENDEIERALLAHARSMAMQQSSGLHIRAVRQLPEAGANQTDKVRMLLNLPESPDQLMSKLKAKVRSQVKKPVRDGLTKRIGAGDLVDDLYRVFAVNMRTLGSPVHSRRWLESIVSLYGDRARIVIVHTPEGAPAAAGVVLIHPSMMSVPWASSLRRYNKYNPNMLLYWTFLTLAIEAGCRCFDFGRSTPGEGTYRFKQQWGAQPEPLYWYDPFAENTKKKGHGRQVASNKTASKRRIAASLWQKIPQAGTDWLGPKVRKYISL